jgi:murein DD-endopeptidase / murein LD-carboxypeptidase
MSQEMTSLPATPVDRARALIGATFRLHGRNAQHGLDCVGLLAQVFDRVDAVPIGYALRNNDEARWAAQIDALAVRRAGEPQPGDIVLMRVSAIQLHLGLWSGNSLIHADAMLGRVVETPGAPPWPIIGIWQVPER